MQNSKWSKFQFFVYFSLSIRWKDLQCMHLDRMSSRLGVYSNRIIQLLGIKSSRKSVILLVRRTCLRPRTWKLPSKTHYRQVRRTSSNIPLFYLKTLCWKKIRQTVATWFQKVTVVENTNTLMVFSTTVQFLNWQKVLWRIFLKNLKIQ